MGHQSNGFDELRSIMPLLLILDDHFLSHLLKTNFNRAGTKLRKLLKLSPFIEPHIEKQVNNFFYAALLI